MSMSLETSHKWHLLDGQRWGVCLELGFRASKKRAESAWEYGEVGITIHRGGSEGDGPPGM